MAEIFLPEAAMAGMTRVERKPKLRCYEQKRLLEIMLSDEISPLWED